ncbi:transmembrane protein 266 [Ixodes scapularis]|uniref:transmembrane protein 266 n=1 Tax=Ixodes scapularis TaxID=6945 RepID=UPI001C394EB6|nr:transmembrane protein 266 [Ixodes scapularis]
MAPSISKEELMRNSDPLVWELGGTDDAEKTERLCECLWIALNSRFCNIIIVTITVIESLVILSELLIDLEYIQDPAWHPKNYNCSVNQTLPAYPSARLKAAKTILSYLSLAILTIFLTEVIFRIVTGKSRFLVQGLEILDAVIIITAFSLDVAFYASPTKDKAKEAAVLIVLLRVWRIKRVIDSIVDVEKLKLSYIISEYQREKTISENKGEVLILRVEDLEHEVAYLKEKHKKTEKELQALRKRGKRDSGSSSSSSCRHATVTIGIETCLPSSSSVETQTSDLSDKQQHGTCLSGSSFLRCAACAVTEAKWNCKFARYAVELAAFYFTAIHRPGRENVAENLPRYHVPQQACLVLKLQDLELVHMQQTDEYCHQILEKLENQPDTQPETSSRPLKVFILCINPRNKWRP